MRWFFILITIGGLTFLDYQYNTIPTLTKYTGQYSFCTTTTIPPAPQSPYDTLQEQPLILWNPTEQILLRKINHGILHNVFPRRDDLLSHLNPEHSITTMNANKHALAIYSKGDWEINLSDSLLNMMAVQQTNLFKAIKDYGHFSYQLKQIYTWNDSAQQYSPNYQTAEIEIYEFAPKKIYDNFYPQSTQLHWKDDFDSIAIFQALIPGHYVNNSNNTKLLGEPAITWRCDSCPINQEFKDYFDSIPTTFPYANGVQTRLKEVFSFYNDKGMQQKLFYFTSASELDFTLTGRFAKGYMGMALLEQQADSSWQTQYFNPTVNMLGSFQTPPLLEHYNDKNIDLFVANNRIGGAGQAYYETMYIYQFIDYQPKLVLVKNISARDNHPSNWNSSLSIIPSNKQHPDLQVLIRGSIDKNDSSDLPPLVELSPKLAAAFEAQLSFSFSILQTYSWDSKKQSYQLSKEQLTTDTNNA